MYEAFYGLNSKPFQLNPDPSFYFGSKQHNDEPGQKTPDNAAESHVRSFHEITGYHIQATDGDMGHVDNLLFDNEQWGVRYCPSSDKYGLLTA